MYPENLRYTIGLDGCCTPLFDCSYLVLPPFLSRTTSYLKLRRTNLYYLKSLNCFRILPIRLVVPVPFVVLSSYSRSASSFPQTFPWAVASSSRKHRCIQPTQRPRLHLSLPSSRKPSTEQPSAASLASSPKSPPAVISLEKFPRSHLIVAGLPTTERSATSILSPQESSHLSSRPLQHPHLGDGPIGLSPTSGGPHTSSSNTSGRHRLYRMDPAPLPPPRPSVIPMLVPVHHRPTPSIDRDQEEQHIPSKKEEQHGVNLGMEAQIRPPPPPPPPPFPSL
jgi:hypothetical protein